MHDDPESPPDPRPAVAPWEDDEWFDDHSPDEFEYEPWDDDPVTPIEELCRAARIVAAERIDRRGNDGEGATLAPGDSATD